MTHRSERRSDSPLAVIRGFPRAKVLVAGDLMLDQFIWGKVERISPEAPVPVVEVGTENFRLGGAANVVRNILSLGGRASACGVVGQDAAGRYLVRELTRIGADAAGVIRGRRDATTQKTRIFAHHQQVVRFDREDGAREKSRAAARARAFLMEHLWDADAVVLSDYGKGVVTPDLLAALAAARARRPFRLIIDPKRGNFPWYRGASLVTPNRQEAAHASGVSIDDATSLRRAGAALLRKWEAEAVLITCGEDGMALFRSGMPMRRFPTAARHVFDVTGAGDTVVATFALAMAAGAGHNTAAALANHAAGIVVGEVGTATVSAERLCAEMTRSPGRRRHKQVRR